MVAAVDGGIVRPAEWRRVREFAVDTPASPALLAVLGEAGAGKSTLWRGGVQAAVPAAAVIDLAPLDMRQIRNLLPGHVTAAQARMVARQSRGNPFWALQVAAAPDPGPQGALPGAPVPPLARTLTDRLSRSLSAEAAQALAVVAAAGRITMPQALAVLDHLDDPAGALDAAVLAGVVEET